MPSSAEASAEAAGPSGRGEGRSGGPAGPTEPSGRSQARPGALADHERNPQGYRGDLMDHVLPWEEPEFQGA
eukprot:3360029-Alexandrium_andersonii.AAC.1